MTVKILAIDIGMTNIDLVWQTDQGLVMRMVKNQQQDATGQLRQALGVFGDEISPDMHIGVTGGRFRDLPDEVDGNKIYKVDEMRAMGLGGLALSGLDAGLVVSAGTGAAMVAAKASGIEHVTGSAVGGGTLLGLSRLILGTSDVDEVNRLALAGDASAVDIMLKEAVGTEVGRLPSHANAVNLGKLDRENNFSKENLAAGLVRLVAQVIAVIAINASDVAGLTEIIMIGHLMDLESIRKEINLVGEFYQRSFNMPKDAGFGTAMGVFTALEQDHF